METRRYLVDFKMQEVNMYIDEAMQKIKEYKTACGEYRILSVELINKYLQE